MKTMIPQKKRIAGFSLVELAIALLIVSILMAAGLSLATVKREAAQREVTQKNQEAIKQALISYLGKNQRLPCPATVITTATPPYTGLEDRTGSPCGQYFGIVPYQELGLDRSVALDGWENFITYVVSPPVSSTPAPPPTTAPMPQWTTAWLYKYSPTCTTNTCTGNTTPANPNPLGAGPYAFWPSSSTGGITVRDTYGDATNQIADPARATGAVVALISYGKNSYGAFNIKGGTNSGLPPTNTDEKYNTNPYLVPFQPIVIKRDPTDSPSAPGGPFDDIVIIITANDLIGPLTANGTLQSSAQMALSQANNIVLGDIIATKASCTPCTFTVRTTNNFQLNISFPASVSALGVAYASVGLTLSYNTPPAPAYTLTAGDGTKKSVSTTELAGMIGQAISFY